MHVAVELDPIVYTIFTDGRTPTREETDQSNDSYATKDFRGK